jgi:hypothetical protein
MGTDIVVAWRIYMLAAEKTNCLLWHLSSWVIGGQPVAVHQLWQYCACEFLDYPGHVRPDIAGVLSSPALSA